MGTWRVWDKPLRWFTHQLSPSSYRSDRKHTPSYHKVKSLWLGQGFVTSYDPWHVCMSFSKYLHVILQTQHSLAKSERSCAVSAPSLSFRSVASAAAGHGHGVAGFHHWKNQSHKFLAPNNIRSYHTLWLQTKSSARNMFNPEQVKQDSEKKSLNRLQLCICAQIYSDDMG